RVATRLRHARSAQPCDRRIARLHHPAHEEQTSRVRVAQREQERMIRIEDLRRWRPATVTRPGYRKDDYRRGSSFSAGLVDIDKSLVNHVANLQPVICDASKIGRTAESVRHAQIL